MEAMAREWSDDRLDALNEKVDLGFKHVDQRFEQIDQRFNRVEAEVHGLRLEMKDEFKALRGEINGVQRTLVFGFIAMSSAIVAGFAAMVSVQI